MKYGICELALVAVRRLAGDQSEMVNQLLFGDLILIKDKHHHWLLIESTDDNYEGWVDEKQITYIEEDVFTALSASPPVYLLDENAIATCKQLHKYISIGSRLPFYQDGQFVIKENTYRIDAHVKLTSGKSGREDLINTALKFLGTPYLWGGRSLYGIDCSGFVQLVFKMHGHMIQRDARQQVEHGRLLNFVTEALPGDLAFFDNEEGLITHVGIILPESRIIHASGEVRIDSIDHQGIFNESLQKYSHKLRLIKSFLP